MTAPLLPLDKIAAADLIPDLELDFQALVLDLNREMQAAGIPGLLRTNVHQDLRVELLLHSAANQPQNPETSMRSRTNPQTDILGAGILFACAVAVAVISLTAFTASILGGLLSPVFRSTDGSRP